MAWASKTKNTGITPTYKSKIDTNFELGYLVTPDNAQILVGADEDLILIYQEAGTMWNNGKLKSAGNSWSNKTKVPLV